MGAQDPLLVFLLCVGAVLLILQFYYFIRCMEDWCSRLCSLEVHRPLVSCYLWIMTCMCHLMIWLWYWILSNYNSFNNIFYFFEEWFIPCNHPRLFIFLTCVTILMLVCCLYSIEYCMHHTMRTRMCDTAPAAKSFLLMGNRVIKAHSLEPFELDALSNVWHLAMYSSK